jgi:hypothetical protein
VSSSCRIPASIAARPGANLLQAGSKAVNSKSLTRPARANKAAPTTSSPWTTFQRRKSPLRTSSRPAWTIVSSTPSTSHPDCEFKRAWCSCASTRTSSRTASGVAVNRTSRSASALRRAQRRSSARRRRDMPAIQASEDMGPSTRASFFTCRTHAGCRGHWRRNSRSHSACTGTDEIKNRAEGGNVSLNARANKAKVSRGASWLTNGATDQNCGVPSKHTVGKREFSSIRKAGKIAARRPPSVTTTTRRARESRSARLQDDFHQDRNHAGRQVGLPHATARRSHSGSYRSSSSNLSITR